jgi:hypothetical protein
LRSTQKARLYRRQLRRRNNSLAEGRRNVKRRGLSGAGELA